MSTWLQRLPWGLLEFDDDTMSFTKPVTDTTGVLSGLNIMLMGSFYMERMPQHVRVAASSLSLSQLFLQRQIRKRIWCKCRLIIFLLISLPLLRDEEYQYLKLHNLVSDNNNNSGNNRSRQEETANNHTIREDNGNGEGLFRLE
eukprot:12456026-Ditylum_brightwellii.AAC.1